MDKNPLNQNLLPLAILAIAGALLYVGLTDSGKAPAPSARHTRVQETVNRHLEKTAEELELRKRRMQIENQRLTMEYADSTPDPLRAAPREGAELRHDQRSERLAEDLGVDSRKQLSMNPMDMIHQQIFEKERAQQMSDAFKKAYAQQYIENARRSGYEVKLSDDFRVISVKPARRPSGSPSQ